MKRRKNHLVSCDRTKHCLCKRIAYHEAGHAIMAWLYGAKILSINTRDNNEIWAEVSLEWPDDELICAMISLAGPMAEAIVAHSPSIYQNEPEVAQVVEELGEFETLLLALPVTKKLMYNWKSVECLAVEILNSRNIIRTKQFLRIMEKIAGTG